MRYGCGPTSRRCGHHGMRLLHCSLLGHGAGRDARGRKVLRPTVRVPTWEQPMLTALTGGIRRRGHSHESIRERDARACWKDSAGIFTCDTLFLLPRPRMRSVLRACARI